MRQIFLTISGVNYLLFEVAITDEKNGKKLYKKIKSDGHILQGVGDVQKGGFFTSGYAIVNVLVEESKIKDFSNFLLSL